MSGGGNGLGKAICLKLASLGCNVAIADIDKVAADKTVSEMSRFNVLTMAFKVDITKSNEIIELRDELTHQIGVVDILVGNS